MKFGSTLRGSITVTTLVATFASALVLAACGEKVPEQDSAPVVAATEASGSSGPTEKPGKPGNGSSSAELSSSAPERESNEVQPDGNSASPNSAAGYTSVDRIQPLYSSSESNFGASRPTVRIASTSRRLLELVADHTSGSSELEPNFTTKVSRNRQVIAVFLPASVPGTTVSVTNVMTNGSATKVYALQLSPGNECVDSGGASSRPNAWVETKKTPQKATLVVVKRTKRC